MLPQKTPAGEVVALATCRKTRPDLAPLEIRLNRSSPWCASALMELCNMSRYAHLQVKFAVSAKGVGHAVLAMR